jgi:hypothetical protein
MPSTPRLPERSRTESALQVGDFHVNELAADQAGPLSPYGPELEFPLPLERLRYTHPDPKARPNLAGGR